MTRIPLSPPRLSQIVTLQFKEISREPFGDVVQYNLEDFRPYLPETFHRVVTDEGKVYLHVFDDVYLALGDTIELIFKEQHVWHRH